MIKSSPDLFLNYPAATPLIWLFVPFERGNSILFNLAVGYVISFIFYIMVVALPENRKRRLFKKRLINRYRWFRQNVVDILMNSYEDYRRKYDHENKLKYFGDQRGLIEGLVDYKKFRDFFRENHHQNWYAVLNGLQYEKRFISDLYVEFRLLSDEIFYVLHNVNMDDDQVSSFFHNFFSHTYRLKETSVFSEDQAKYFGGFLWEIMAQFSIIDDNREKDPFMVAINQI